MDDFKNHPSSITEIKANKAANGALWTPRDALINLLREIDNGLNVDMLFVSYRIDTKDNSYEYSYANATPNLVTAVGLCTLVQALIVRNTQ